MTVVKYEGFEELTEFGFQSDYVEIKDGVCRPAIDLEWCLENYSPAGSKVMYNGCHGSSWNQEFAEKRGIKIGDMLTVKTCRIGGSSSDYSFEECEGEFNTVLFDKVYDDINPIGWGYYIGELEKRDDNVSKNSARRIKYLLAWIKNYG